MILVDQLIEQVRRLINGGDLASHNSTPTPREILLHIRQGLAACMKNSFYEGVKFDDILYANDQYSFNFKDATVQSEQDYKFITLPSIPIELPRSRGIVSIRPAGSIGHAYDPIQRKDLDVILMDSRNKKKRVVYFQEGNLIKFKLLNGAAMPGTVDGTVVAPGTIELGSTLLISDDVQAKIIEYVLSVYGHSKESLDDQNTDGINAV